MGIGRDSTCFRSPSETWVRFFGNPTIRGQILVKISRSKLWDLVASLHQATLGEKFGVRPEGKPCSES